MSGLCIGITLSVPLPAILSARPNCFAINSTPNEWIQYDLKHMETCLYDQYRTFFVLLKLLKIICFQKSYKNKSTSPTQ